MMIFVLLWCFERWVMDGGTDRLCRMGHLVQIAGYESGVCSYV